MNKQLYQSHFFLIAALVLLLSLPTSLTRNTKFYLSKILSVHAPIYHDPSGKEELQKQVETLQLELLALAQELEANYALIQQKEAQEAKITALQKQTLNTYYQRDLKNLLTHQFNGTLARVITYPANSWEQCFWIDLGTDALPELKKNSPAVFGNTLVGVVEEIHPTRSRVRLITDPKLQPAVRVARGEPKYDQELHLLKKIQRMLSFTSFGLSTHEQEALFFLLKKAQSKHAEPTQYLAKGTLQGIPQGQWRDAKPYLHGYGFNYDHSDERGPARDLPTGTPLDPHSTEKPTPIVEKGDLLVTSGLDGIFPSGLHVANVINVLPAPEGAYFYELTALPIMGELTHLSHVFVLPPVP